MTEPPALMTMPDEGVSGLWLWQGAPLDQQNAPPDQQKRQWVPRRGTLWLSIGAALIVAALSTLAVFVLIVPGLPQPATPSASSPATAAIDTPISPLPTVDTPSSPPVADTPAPPPATVDTPASTAAGASAPLWRRLRSVLPLECRRSQLRAIERPSRRHREPPHPLLGACRRRDRVRWQRKQEDHWPICIPRRRSKMEHCARFRTTEIFLATKGREGCAAPPARDRGYLIRRVLGSL